MLQTVRDVWGDGQSGSYNYTSVYPYHRSFDGLGNAVHEMVVNLTGLGTIGLVSENLTRRAVETVGTGADLDAELESDVETDAEAETETLVYGEGPLKPVDGIMDRGFSTRGHSHHHHHHQ